MRAQWLIVIALLATPNTFAQEMSPEARDALARIASDPRFDDPKKFADALEPMASLKTKLTGSPRLGDLNAIYDWSLTPDGRWPIERTNDIIFEVVMSPHYNEGTFLRALEVGAPFLRRLRARGCVDSFNTKYKLAIPATGGLSFAQTDRFLYSVVVAPDFDAERVLEDVCTGITPPKRAPAAVSTTPRSPVTVGATVAQDQTNSGRMQGLMIIFGGGAVVVALVVLLLRSFMRDRRA